MQKHAPHQPQPSKDFSGQPLQYWKCLFGQDEGRTVPDVMLGS